MLLVIHWSYILISISFLPSNTSKLIESKNCPLVMGGLPCTNLLLPSEILSPMETHSSRPTAWFIGSVLACRPAPRFKEQSAHVSACMPWTNPTVMK